MFLVGAGFMIMHGKERSQILTLKLLLLKCQILMSDLDLCQTLNWSMSDLDVKHVMLFEGLELFANCFEEKCSRWPVASEFWNIECQILDIVYPILDILNIKKWILGMWYWKVIQMIWQVGNVEYAQ